MSVYWLKTIAWRLPSAGAAQLPQDGPELAQLAVGRESFDRFEQRQDLAPTALR